MENTIIYPTIKLNGNNKEKLIKKVKRLLLQREKLKYEIAKLTIQIFGYNNRNGSRIGYNLKKFAKDIGVNHSTLTTWRREYFLVLSKIQIEDNKVSRKALENTLKKVKTSTKKEVVNQIYKAEIKKLTVEDYQLDEYIKRLKNVEFGICYTLDLNQLDFSKLNKVHLIVKNIDKKLNEFNNGNYKTIEEQAINKYSNFIQD